MTDLVIRRKLRPAGRLRRSSPVVELVRQLARLWIDGVAGLFREMSGRDAAGRWMVR